jgi:hypothetical protein
LAFPLTRIRTYVGGSTVIVGDDLNSLQDFAGDALTNEYTFKAIQIDGTGGAVPSVAAGDLVVSSDITATAGHITATAGNVVVTAGNITVSAGGITATLGTVTAVNVTASTDVRTNRLLATGTVPSITAGAAAGDTVTGLTITGDDLCHLVTITPGGAGITAAGILFNVTFGRSYVAGTAAAPIPFPQTVGAAGLDPWISAISANGYSVSAGTTGAAITTAVPYSFFVVVPGYTT